MRKKPNPMVRFEPARGLSPVARKIIDRLLEWVDPWNGSKVIQRVHRREKIYSGAQASLAPDIFIEWNQDGKYGYLWRPSGNGPSRFSRGNVWTSEQQ